MCFSYYDNLNRDRKHLKIGYGALAAITAAFFLTSGISFSLDNVNFDSANLFSTVSADDPKTHEIEMTALKLPNGQLAYQMINHRIDGEDITEQLYGANPTPSIPVPAMTID